VNLAEKVIGICLVGLMALISWNLVSTINIQQELLKLQHEQTHLHENIDKQFKIIKNKLAKKKNK